MVIGILSILFVGLCMLRIPVGFVLGTVTVLMLLIFPKAPLIIVPTRMLAAVDSFVLLAVPLFILAGTLMETGGIARRLVNLATVLVGHVKGALGMIVVVAEMFFSGISGSTVADVSAMSSMLLPSMKQAGYKTDYSVAIISAASAMGILIPPCILMVVLGAMINVSIAALFFGGFLPALLLASLLMALLAYQARIYDLPKGEKATLRQMGVAVLESLIPFGMPLIIFGGILGGVFSPTEAAGIAVTYALVVGMFVYKEIKPRDLIPTLMQTGVTTAVVLLLVQTATLLSYFLAIEHVPALLSGLLLSISDSKVFFLMVSNFIFIFFSDVLDALPAMIIFVPILYPIAVQLQVDLLHWGILTIAALGIGLFLPPAGVGIIVAASVGKVSMDAVMKPLFPFIVMLCLGLLVLTLIPEISTIVPKMSKMW